MIVVMMMMIAWCAERKIACAYFETIVICLFASRQHNMATNEICIQFVDTQLHAQQFNVYHIKGWEGIKSYEAYSSFQKLLAQDQMPIMKLELLAQQKSEFLKYKTNPF